MIPSFRFLLTDKRAQVYLVWLVIVAAGFIATHFKMSASVNTGWLITVALGLAFMVYAMPLKYKFMQRIFAVWAITLSLGMIVSIGVFLLPSLAPLIQYLGTFWMLLLAVGYALNGIVDPPSKWYNVATVTHIAGAGLTMLSSELLFYQYIIATVATVLGMGGLWLFRSDEN